jgi:Mn2+/Fe2+ NRAMP family transporter
MFVADRTNKPEAGTDLREGLPMISKWEPEKLAQEQAELAALADKPVGQRMAYYAKRLGPGFMQSAMTLGSGSAGSSLFAGALLGYTLLWAQPVGMLLGIIMLAAISYQTLSTRVRPFDALRRFVSPTVAWGFALGSLAATIIWHFPQYSMCSAVGVDIVNVVAGVEIPTWSVGIFALIVCTAVTWGYGSGAKGVRIYERLLKYMVWGVVFAFAAVVIKLAMMGRIDWGAVGKGFYGFQLPGDDRGRTVLFGALGAAVGINMVFLFPYTLLARGWGKEHRECSRFDLAAGMFLPYAIATSLMIIATSATIHGTEHVPEKGAFLQPVAAGEILAPVVGTNIGRLVFGLGVFGMTLSTITLHMLVSAFIVCECLGWEPTGSKYYIASLIPAVGVLGSVYWGEIALWLAVPTSAACGALLPLAYVGFIVLFNHKGYMGDAKPKGAAMVIWNVLMMVSFIASIGYMMYQLTKVPDWFAAIAPKIGL